MRRILSLVAACAIAALWSGPAAVPEAPDAPTARFTILHFNDFHGQVEPLDLPAGQPCGGLARLAGQVEAERSAASQRGETALLLFAGDLFTGTSFSALFQGGPEFRVLSAMRLTAMTVGNHEWDFGQGVLLSRTKHAGFPIVAANLVTKNAEHVFYQRSLNLRAGDARVGVIGVTTTDTPLMTAPGKTEGYTFKDPLAAIGEVLAEHRGDWDFIVVLSHCGINVDKTIADKFPQVGLIVGGHDHIALEQPVVVGGVPIVQAGDRGRFLGQVRVEIQKGAKAKVTGKLIPITSSLPEDAGVRDQLAPDLAEETSSLGEAVGTLPSALPGDRFVTRSQETALGDLITDAMRAETKSDLALLNGGTIRAGLPAGKVTGKDLLACLPFFDTLCTVQLTGAQIQALLDRCAAMSVEVAPGGFLQVSGLSARYEGGKAQDVRVGGHPIDPSREYRVACCSFLLAGGDGHEEFKQGRDARNWGVGIEELLHRELAKPGIKLPEPGKRIVRAPATPERKAA